MGSDALLNGTRSWEKLEVEGGDTLSLDAWITRNQTIISKNGISASGDLELYDAEGAPLWPVNISRKASQTVILDSVDTVLPGMRFGGQHKLVSWKSSFNPAPGLLSCPVDPTGAKQLVLWLSSVCSHDSS
ncbi:hypothetical protein SUGI_0663320 [Cryptomeria japonica]|nr:hypothetical protein SUGI_0663320 [Cryptomeria japonica]